MAGGLAVAPEAFGWEAASAAKARLPQSPSTARGGAVRYEFRLAVAASSRYAAKFGSTVEAALAEIVHAVNRANEVFETDAGVHFTLVGDNERLVRVRPARDPFRSEDPGPAAVRLIEREIGRGNYDLGHALTDYSGGESHVGTSCSDALDADFLATHKAAAWSGHAHPDTSPDAIRFMIHVLGRQLGAWPSANGCTRSTLDDRAFEPGSGSTIMGNAPARCGREQSLQPHADLYFHAANIAQMHDWLASRGGRCAFRRLNPASAPWIAPETLADRTVIPARTPFALDATAEPGTPGRRLTYAWEQMDAGAKQRGALLDHGSGPLFRSFPPSPSGIRIFPRVAAPRGFDPSTRGETLPSTSRTLNFRLTVRDNGGDTSTVAHADRRIDVVDTGRPFAVLEDASPTLAIAGEPRTVRWDVADTNKAPISCHFVDIDLSLDGGQSWLEPALVTDEANDGEASPVLPFRIASEHARLRIRCDWRPFFAVSPTDFTIVRTLMR
jgi:hypothetical protein